MPVQYDTDFGSSLNNTIIIVETSDKVIKTWITE